MAWVSATKEVKAIKELTPLKQALRELAALGKEEHEGPLIDLAVLLSKIVRTYEHKGIQYTLEKYAPELIKPQQAWLVLCELSLLAFTNNSNVQP